MTVNWVELLVLYTAVLVTLLFANAIGWITLATW